MSYATDTELQRYPILHFAFENLDMDGRAMYTLACQGQALGVREQLEAIWASGHTAGQQVDPDVLQDEYNAGWEAGHAAALDKADS